VTRFPPTPNGWTVSARSSVGPFATHVTWRRADGGVTEWASRAHRKRTSRLAGHAAGVWWAPWRVSWWIGVLFALGSTCFFVGPFPGFVELVGSQVDGIVFFVGSIFFTSAAALLWLETINAQHGPVASKRRFRAVSFEPHRIDWWSSGVQLVGTLFFNIDTFRAMQAGLDAQAYDRLVWTPDVVGSACFLVSGYLAYADQQFRRVHLGGEGATIELEWLGGENRHAGDAN
jgi:hypothetical protein